MVEEQPQEDEAAFDLVTWLVLHDGATFGAAEHFARRLLPRGIIVEGTVKKEHVIVYLSPNNEEDEVIVSPEHVTDIVSVG